MRKQIFFMVLGMATAAGLQGAEDTIGDTRASLEKWVQTRQMISRVQSDWAAERETLQQTIKLYEGDLAKFKELIAGVDTSNNQADKEKKEQDELKAGLEAASSKAKELIAALEGQMRSLVKRLPPALTELPGFTDFIKKLPADSADTKLSISQRTQTLVAILSEVDKFNGSVTVSPEIRKSASGGEVQVKTLYLGLAQAWFVDQEGAFAGVGTPGPGGWTWSSQPELAPKITKAIAIYENAQPAAFVGLPLKIQ